MRRTPRGSRIQGLGCVPRRRRDRRRRARGAPPIRLGPSRDGLGGDRRVGRGCGGDAGGRDHGANAVETTKSRFRTSFDSWMIVLLSIIYLNLP